jgi:hypothetical protein
MKFFERIRQKSYELYNEELNKTGNDEIALETTLAYIEQEFKQRFCKGRSQNNFKKGLISEIEFYHLCRKELMLKPSSARIDKYFKVDFKGRDPVTRKPILIDVTTNPYPKLKKAKLGEFKKILSDLKFLGSAYLYRVAVFDPASGQHKLTSLMLPVHNEGYIGHYIIQLEPDIKDVSLVEMDAYIFVVYLDDPFNPSEAIDAEHIRSYMFFPGSVPDLDALLFEFKEFEEAGYNINTEEFVAENRGEIAYFARKEVGILPSAVFDLKYIITGKNGEGYWDYVVTWIHSLPLIKKVFGALLEPTFVDLSITY